MADNYKRNDDTDTGFWGKVFQLVSFNKPRYPALTTLVSSLLTIFSGPLVESSFNIMDDIVQHDRARLTIENYEAVAIVKSTLKKKKLKSYNMPVDSKMKQSCIRAFATYKTFLQDKKKNSKKEELTREKLSVSVQQLKAEKAKRVKKLLILKQRVMRQQSGRKRTLEHSTASENRWKRIKCST